MVSSANASLTQIILELVGLVVVGCALIPPLISLIFGETDDLDTRPKRYRGR